MPKRPHPPPTRRKKTPKAPETADEYLAVAVDLEESGERWRSGDVAKAGRFYVQAITAYEATLARYPNNFDARYNRARLLYTLTQLPLPSTFFPPTSTPLSRLSAAVAAHKECNDLEQDSSDILFNYGQTLSSLGEFYADKSTGPYERPQTEEEEVQRLLQAREALESSYQVFRQCLAVQEADYKSSLEQSQSFNSTDQPDGFADEEDMEDNGGVKLPENFLVSMERRDSSTSSHSSNGNGSGSQWAAIVEPTTKATILDTAVAMLEVQTSILGLSNPGTFRRIFPENYVDEIASHAKELLESYILPLAGDLHQDSTLDPPEVVEKETEAVLARANFVVSLAEARFYLSSITAENWEDEVKTSFSPFTFPSGRVIDLGTSWMALCDRSTAYTTISTTISPTDPLKSWKLANLASQDLAEATKLAPEKSKSEVYLARGNLELIRSRIPADAAERSKGVLRKNAGVYYRGVVKTGGSSMIGAVEGVRVKEVMAEARVKEAVIPLEDEGNGDGLKVLVKDGVERRLIWRIVRAAIEEGVFTKDALSAVEAILT